MRSELFGSGGPRTEPLTLPEDSLGFVRRECPACHRLFKVRPGEAEATLMLQKVTNRVAHQNQDEIRGRLVVRWCPYCGQHALADAWYTAEQRAWLQKRADVFALELRYEQLSMVERSVADNAGPTFLAVRPHPAPNALQPEPEDMRVVPLLCCGEEVKITDGWSGTLRCFFCGAEHELGAELVRAKLDKLLR